MAVPELETPRLRLRGWLAQDREPFAAINADPEVMRYMGGVLERGTSDALVDRIERHFDAHGFGLWAAEARESGRCIGYIGLMIPRFELPFRSRAEPCVEAAWRLASDCWRRGLATEGARAALSYGFGVLELPEIVSLTSVGNRASRRVMEKLGMQRNPSEDFDHPALADGHPLRRHVLYRLPRERWREIGW